MLKDIGHPYTDGREQYDITFENVQAGERTSHLFRLANLNDAIVVGTGDLSELALGWCTYGVGDHMSHYAVNASVPKTLIQHVIRWVADTHRFGPEASATLIEILATQISPELVPARDGEPEQDTEAIVGPYELHDFNLYFTLRFGYAPPKIAFLAWSAWHDRMRGAWPDIPDEKRNQYTLAQVKQHLRTFLYRFFQVSQFKRSAFRMRPRSAPADRCRRAATIAHPAMGSRQPGWRSSISFRKKAPKRHSPTSTSASRRARGSDAGGARECFATSNESVCCARLPLLIQIDYGGGELLAEIIQVGAQRGR